jgi:hypothetical protein
MASALRASFKKVPSFCSTRIRLCSQPSSINQSGSPFQRSALSVRLLSTTPKQPTLKERLAELIPAEQEKVRFALLEHMGALRWHTNVRH